VVAIDGMAPKVISSTWPEKAKCVREKATVVTPSTKGQRREGKAQRSKNIKLL